MILVTHANASVDVETEETDPEKTAELAMENTPSLCANCSGGGSYSMEINNAWETVPLSETDSTPTVYEIEDE